MLLSHEILTSLLHGFSHTTFVWRSGTEMTVAVKNYFLATVDTKVCDGCADLNWCTGG